MLKRQRSKRTYAQMNSSTEYTATINKIKDVKEEDCNRKVPNFKLLIINGPIFFFALYVIVVYTGHQLFVSILKNNFHDEIV